MADKEISNMYVDAMELQIILIVVDMLIITVSLNLLIIFVNKNNIT